MSDLGGTMNENLRDQCPGIDDPGAACTCFALPEPSDSEPCTTLGCPGDARYAAPGRRHAVGCKYPQHSDSEPAPDAAAFALKVAEQQMCPNCVTPWKCNGPHIEQPAPDADRCTGASDCGAPLHVHGCYADMTGPCDDPADHAPDADREAGERA